MQLVDKEREQREAHPFLCPLSLGVPSITSTQVSLCHIAHLIARDSWKCNSVVVQEEEETG